MKNYHPKALKDKSIRMRREGAKRKMIKKNARFSDKKYMTKD
jgi:hypothetical protein